MTVKEFLQSYYQLGIDIRLMNEEVEQLKSLVRKVTPNYNSAGSGGGDKDKLPKTIEKICEIEKQLNNEIAHRSQMRDKVYGIVMSVQSVRHREILYQRYILGKKWENIAVDSRLDLRWVYRLHGQALQIVSKLTIESH